MFLKIMLMTAFFIFPNNVDMQSEIDALEIESENYIVYSIDEDMVVASQNADKKTSTASMNKILTAITIIDMMSEEDLEKEVSVSHEDLNIVAPEASVAGLFVGQVVTIKELLYGTILPSGADAIAVLSHELTENPDELALAMNEKAEAIGMMNTHIRNPYGLDDERQYSTLSDILLLTQYALENDTFAEIFSTASYAYKNNPEITIENGILRQANDLEFKYLKGAKSGYTLDAGRALSSLAGDERMEFIMISNKAGGDYYDTNGALIDAMTVYDYIFSNYKKELVYREDTLIETKKVKRTFKNYDFTFSTDIEAIIPSDFDPKLLLVETEDFDKVKAPLEIGDVVGKVKVYYEGNLLINEDIVVKEDIPISVAYIIVCVLLLFLFVIAFIILILISKRRRFKKKRK